MQAAPVHAQPRRPLRIERPPDTAEQPQQQQQQQQAPDRVQTHGGGGAADAQHAVNRTSSRDSNPGSGRGGVRGRGGSGHGRGTGDGGTGDTGGGGRRGHAWKDQHKGQVANHHRKERAARKTGML